jgi:hypothetical protein
MSKQILRKMGNLGNSSSGVRLVPEFDCRHLTDGQADDERQRVRQQESFCGLRHLRGKTGNKNNWRVMLTFTLCVLTL